MPRGIGISHFTHGGGQFNCMQEGILQLFVVVLDLFLSHLFVGNILHQPNMAG